MHDETVLLACTVLLCTATYCNSEVVSCGDCQIYSKGQTCQAIEVSLPPWSTNETTAPPPQWRQLNWHFYELSNNSLGIALNASWSQRAKDVRQFVEGYYLTVGKQGMLGSYKFLFTLDFAHFHSNKDILFLYDCFGRGDESKILPGDRLYITLHSLPMYQSKTANIGTDITINIPGCEDPQYPNIMYSWYCQNKNSFHEYDLDYYDDHKLNRFDIPKQPKDLHFETKLFKLLLVSAAIGATAALLVSALVSLFKFCYRKQKHLKHLGKEKSSGNSYKTGVLRGPCLVLVSTSGELDTQYCKATNILSDILKHAGLKITCNLWEHICMHDPIEWTSEQLSLFTQIVLVCTPLGKHNWENNQSSRFNCADPFVMSIDTLLKCCKMNVAVDNHNFHVVYFDEDPSVSVPDKVLKLFDCYKLSEQFDCFFKQLTNSPYCGNFPMLFNSFLDVTNKINVKTTQQHFTGEIISPETIPLTQCVWQKQTDHGKDQTVSGHHTSCKKPYDSSISGGSTSYCNYNSASSCEGSQCSCRNLSTLSV